MIELHVLGGAPASGNPGEACSGYLVTAGTTRILLDCGPGVVASLLERDPRPLDAVVLSHGHHDHVGDLITLGYAHRFGIFAGHPAPPVHSPVPLAAMFAATGADPGHLDVRLLDGDLAIGDASVSFRAMVHPGGSNAVRVEHAHSSLCFSGDTTLTPALAEHARGAGVLLCEATMDAESAVHLHASDCGRIAREAGAGALVLTHHLSSERGPAIAAAQAAFGRAVIAATPGLRVAC